jgi:hypothetical protein
MPPLRYPITIATPIANCTDPTAAWNVWYQTGPWLGSTRASSNPEANTRRIPARKATRISQKVHRQPRTTPVDSATRRPAS